MDLHSGQLLVSLLAQLKGTLLAMYWGAERAACLDHCLDKNLVTMKACLKVLCWAMLMVQQLA